jgi:hypothetical protein
MSLEGFKAYKRREFCNDNKRTAQTKLNKLNNIPKSYERIRQTCRTHCKHTTWQFHRWLMEKGYLNLKTKK